jgi:hypothetical protein
MKIMSREGQAFITTSHYMYKNKYVYTNVHKMLITKCVSGIRKMILE